MKMYTNMTDVKEQIKEAHKMINFNNKLSKVYKVYKAISYKLKEMGKRA